MGMETSTTVPPAGASATTRVPSRAPALSQTLQPGTGTVQPSSSHPVVGDPGDDAIGQNLYRNCCPLGVRMLHHIGQRLGADEVDGCLDGGRQALRSDVHLDWERAAIGEVGQRPGESSVRERPGTEAACQLIQLTAGKDHLTEPARPGLRLSVLPTRLGSDGLTEVRPQSGATLVRFGGRECVRTGNQTRRDLK